MYAWLGFHYQSAEGSISAAQCSSFFCCKKNRLPASISELEHGENTLLFITVIHTMHIVSELLLHLFTFLLP